jgi:hypothetical protein
MRYSQSEVFDGLVTGSKMFLAHSGRRLKAIIGVVGDVIISGEDRLEGKGLPSAFSERGSMTRSTSARTRSSGLHHTDLPL